VDWGTGFQADSRQPWDPSEPDHCLQQPNPVGKAGKPRWSGPAVSLLGLETESNPTLATCRFIGCHDP